MTNNDSTITIETTKGDHTFATIEAAAAWLVEHQPSHASVAGGDAIDWVPEDDDDAMVAAVRAALPCYEWRTDGASGELHATSIGAAVAQLMAEREWPTDAELADGGWAWIEGPDGERIEAEAARG